MELGGVRLRFGYPINKSCLIFVLPFVLYLCLLNEIHEDLRFICNNTISLRQILDREILRLKNPL
jgi:hypothetical protein